MGASIFVSPAINCRFFRLFCIGLFVLSISELSVSQTLPPLIEPPISNHGGDAVMLAEHQKALALVNYANTTHAAIKDGSWFDPTVWHNGQVPGNNAIVVVTENRRVFYDGSSNTRLRTVRVDGVLEFSSNQNTKMILDTMFVDSRGTLIIGSKTNPVQSGVSAQIIFANNGDINVLWDPFLLSRGMIVHGSIMVHGQKKSVHHKVVINPLKGQTQITLAQAPLNWKVGDMIILTGTKYSGWKWDNAIGAARYFGTQDEILTISAINGAVISFNTPLVYDHFTPRADLKASVANYSRNVIFETENYQNVPIHQRGHTMFMHTHLADVRYAQFTQLGRTNKAGDLNATDPPDDPKRTFDIHTVTNVTPTTNARGRYPVHVHRSGLHNVDEPAVLAGNAVIGSPGWGYVHHDSNAHFHNNASYDTQGVGFMGEVGNEIGAWTNNIAIKAKGTNSDNPKNGNGYLKSDHDLGRNGAGFWFQGRMVRVVGNIAASVNIGFAYLHRGGQQKYFDASDFMLPEVLKQGQQNGPDDAPILNFDSNETFAAGSGMFVVKANFTQQHDLHTHLSNFKSWEVVTGAAMQYTSHYTLSNFDVIGKTPEPFSTAGDGIQFERNVMDMTIVSPKIDKFANGFILGDPTGIFTVTLPLPEEQFKQYTIINPQITNTPTQYVNFASGFDTVIPSILSLVPGRLNVTINNMASLSYQGQNGVILYTGTKADSISTTAPLPAGNDTIETRMTDFQAILSQDGYYKTSAGVPYVIIEEYFSDRATGQIQKLGLKTLLNGNIASQLGRSGTSWASAINKGTINLNSRAPSTNNDSASTNVEIETTINLLANDTDPDSDPLIIDGIFQPKHGQVFDNGNGNVTYRPDFDFVGTDTFTYWATDRQGNFSPATVNVSVGVPAKPKLPTPSNPRLVQ